MHYARIIRRVEYMQFSFDVIPIYIYTCNLLLNADLFRNRWHIDIYKRYLLCKSRDT